ncbi:MAG: type III-A CRISPR-associated RAMP protein Csm3, partial [Bacteroidaceae bacterium]|nr:type III-A CRISPR-associated RAMP protein Csm3 [Bacteroidaceae bacterium]
DVQKIINLFGFASDNKPSKVIVRDSYLTSDSAKALRNNSNLDMPYTEGKWENVIDRVKGTAEHPRQTERIPAGVRFDVEFVLNIWDNDNEDDMKALLEEGIKALENDYLGGSGSRGYGQVRFAELKPEYITFDNQM